MPTVSIVIPTYNRASLIKEAIKSILEQTYQDFEIIVVDDGSTDNTRETVIALSDKIVYVYQQNQGRSHARNEAIKLARGKYIGFLDSDDLYLPNKLEKQVALLEKELDYGMVYTSAICIDEKGNETSIVYKATSSGRIYREVAFFYPVTVLLPTVMIRAEVLAKLGGFDEKMERFEDTDMWRRAAKVCQVLAIGEPLCKVRTHSGNALEGQDPFKIFNALTYYVNKIFKEDRDVSSIFLHRGAARFCLNYGRAIILQPQWRAIGRKFVSRSLKYWPFQIYPYWLLIRRNIYKWVITPTQKLKKNNVKSKQ